MIIAVGTQAARNSHGLCVPVDVSLRSAGTDLISFFRTTGTHSPWLFLAACVPTAIIIYTFYIDTLEKAKPPHSAIAAFDSSIVRVAGQLSK